MIGTFNDFRGPSPLPFSSGPENPQNFVEEVGGEEIIDICPNTPELLACQ